MIKKQNLFSAIALLLIFLISNNLMAEERNEEKVEEKIEKKTENRVEKEIPRIYVGILGNTSKSRLFDKDGDLTNGNRRSDLNLSLIYGIESKDDITDNGNLRLLIAGETYFDAINKTIKQSENRHYRAENKNAGKPIYTTNFILGARAKIGLEFSKKFNLYGFVGLNYWDKKFYIGIDYDAYDFSRFSATFSYSYGFGGGYNITKNLELNLNYMKLPDKKIFLDDTSGYNVFYNDFENGAVKIGISVITFGLKYKF